MQPGLTVDCIIVNKSTMVILAFLYDLLLSLISCSCQFAFSKIFVLANFVHF